jgi:hypothetical protein
LARQIGDQTGAAFFDMQDPEVAAAFQNPKMVLSPLEGLIVLDEAQLVPALYPVLRVLVDDDRRTGKSRRFLLLGSAAPELIIPYRINKVTLQVQPDSRGHGKNHAPTGQARCGRHH